MKTQAKTTLRFWQYAIPVFIAIITLCFPAQQLQAFQEQTEQESMDFVQYRGDVFDNTSKKPLVFATVGLEGTNISTITNTEGKFLLKIPKETVDGNVLVSFLGYKTKLIPLQQLKSTRNKIGLDVSVTELATA